MYQNNTFKSDCIYSRHASVNKYGEIDPTTRRKGFFMEWHQSNNRVRAIVVDAETQAPVMVGLRQIKFVPEINNTES